MSATHTITELDFGYISELVRKEAAIVLEVGKEYLVEARLAPIAKAEGFTGIPQLVDAVKYNKVPGLVVKIVQALTTNETSFMRDLEPFEAMRETLLPEMMKKRKDKKALSIWSAASSTGQETYSLCMIMREHFPELAGWNVTILGTDINQLCVDKAQSGTYSQFEVNRGLPAKYLIKYFEKQDTNWKIKDDIRSMAAFKVLNLIHDFPPMPAFDFIMLRNVLIYFDLQTKKDILRRVRRVLQPDGFLFLGAAETTLNIDDSFERRVIEKTSCYRIKS